MLKHLKGLRSNMDKLFEKLDTSDMVMCSNMFDSLRRLKVLKHVEDWEYWNDNQ